MEAVAVPEGGMRRASQKASIRRCMHSTAQQSPYSTPCSIRLDMMKASLLGVLVSQRLDDPQLWESRVALCDGLPPGRRGSLAEAGFEVRKSASIGPLTHIRRCVCPWPECCLDLAPQRCDRGPQGWSGGSNDAAQHRSSEKRCICVALQCVLHLLGSPGESPGRRVKLLA